MWFAKNVAAVVTVTTVASYSYDISDSWALIPIAQMPPPASYARLIVSCG